MNKRRQKGSTKARTTSVKLLPEDERLLSELRKRNYWNTSGKLLSWAIRAKHLELFGDTVSQSEKQIDDLAKPTPIPTEETSDEQFDPSVKEADGEAFTDVVTQHNPRGMTSSIDWPFCEDEKELRWFTVLSKTPRSTKEKAPYFILKVKGHGPEEFSLFVFDLYAPDIIMPGSKYVAMVKRGAKGLGCSYRSFTQVA